MVAKLELSPQEIILQDTTQPLVEVAQNTAVEEVISLGFPAGRNRLFDLLLDVYQRSESEAITLLDSVVSSWGLTKRAVKALESEFEKFLNSKTVKLDPSQQLPIGWHVLGYTSTHEVLLWEKGRSHRLSANELRGSNPAMSLLFGPKAPHDELGTAIITQAHERGLLDTQETLRRGVWRLRDGWGVISGKEVLQYNGGRWVDINIPILDGKIVALEKQPWINFELIKKPPYTLKEALAKTIDLVSKWNWSAKGNGPTASQLIAAFLAISPFQQSLKWRPWIYITGARGTGKSTFFDEILGGLWRNLAAPLGKTTAHAISQTVANTGAIPVLDEFEKIKNQDQILELLKISNGGGVKTIGTPGTSAIEFNLRHIPWLGSIYLPLTFSTDAAQMSRVVFFCLEKHSGKIINIPSSTELENISASIIAGVISQWIDIEDEVLSIYATKHEQTVDGRMVDNLAYALAVLKVAGICEPIIPSWAGDFEIKDDGESIIEAIMSCKIRSTITLGTYLVSDLIQCALKRGSPPGLELSESSAKTDLRLNGLTVVGGNSKKWALALREEEVKPLLAKTAFCDLNISEPLKRLPGVENNKLAEWGNQDKKKAMHIPGRLIDKIIGSNYAEDV